MTPDRQQRWKTPLWLVIFGALLVVGLLKLPAWLYERDPSIELNELIGRWHDDAMDYEVPRPLASDWVGTVKRVHVMGVGEDFGIAAQDEVRFTYGAMSYGFLNIGTSNSTHLSWDNPHYRGELPEVDEIKQCKTLHELRKFLGPRPRPMIGEPGWALFTPEGKERLRYLFVMAFYDTITEADEFQLNGMVIREGWMSPAKAEK